MLPRIASALVLIPMALALVFFASPAVLLCALGILGTACLHEYFRLMGKMGLRGQPWFGYAGLWFLILCLHIKLLPGELLLSFVVVGTFLVSVGRRVPVRECVTGMMVNLLGILYLGLCLYPALPLRYEFGEKLGLQWVLILLSVIWVGDTAALLAGRAFGRTRFSPVISPKKTNEGAAAGLLAGIGVALLFQRLFFPELPAKHVGAVALLLGAAGQLGDLAESMLKRAADIKDSSDLIPGHGGVLDRIDSLLFAIPVLYLYLLKLYAP
jgi:phosphatidate cytidylyltransferase